jgi:hypothetical protein
MARNKQSTPPKFDAVERAKADAAILNESHANANANAHAMVRSALLDSLPFGSVVMVQYADTLKGSLSGIAALSCSHYVVNARRIAIGCADAKVAALVAPLLKDGKKLQDVIKEAGVPAMSNAGRKSDASKGKPSPVDAVIAAFNALSAADQSAALDKILSARILRIKSPQVRVAATQALAEVRAA